ncbi:MAG: hypothetical protein JWN08_1037 [Frankiales bacterium]|nr:hypothetical protein [Frankiales bacterium]
MPLQLLTPPALVDVRDPDGSVRPALLLGRRDDRRFVQVSHAAGDNRLRWVAAADVRAASGLASSPYEATTSAAVALSGPRSQR